MKAYTDVIECLNFYRTIKPEIRIFIVPDGQVSLKKEWDICPECQKNLEDWMNQKREKLDMPKLNEEISDLFFK